MKAKKIIICLLIILCLILLGCGNETAYKNNFKTENEFTINNVRMSSDINSLSLHERTSSSFYTNSKYIYVTGRYENADANSVVEFIWKYNGKKIHEDTLSCNEFSSDFRTYLSSNNGWKTGKYCVEMYLNNNSKPVKTINFFIKARNDFSGPTVYITKTGAKYHSNGCRCLSKSKIPISLKDAKKRGYDPCGICKPPR